MILGELTNPQRSQGLKAHTAIGPDAKNTAGRIKREAFWLEGTANVEQWFKDSVLPSFEGNFRDASVGLYLAVTDKTSLPQNPDLRAMRDELTEFNPILGKLTLAA